MENGEVVKMMAIGSTSIEECEGSEFAAMRLMNPKIIKRSKEHVMFEDMLRLVDMRKPMKEEDSTNQGAQESQISRNNDELDREIENSVD